MPCKYVNTSPQLSGPPAFTLGTWDPTMAQLPLTYLLTNCFSGSDPAPKLMHGVPAGSAAGSADSQTDLSTISILKTANGSPRTAVQLARFEPSTEIHRRPTGRLADWMFLPTDRPSIQTISIIDIQNGSTPRCLAAIRLPGRLQSNHATRLAQIFQPEAFDSN